MQGELRLRLCAADGQTRVIESYAHAPFHYLPPAAGEPPLLTIVNSSGGVLGGDVLEMAVSLDAHAKLTLRSQAATKLYRSAGSPARSVCRFRLADAALLDYFPDEIIPFAGSDYEQLTVVDLAAGANAIVCEIVTAGRLARAERFAFTRLILDLRCTDGGRLLLRDRAELRPGTQNLAAPAVLGEGTVWGSLYLLTTDKLDASLVERVHETLHAMENGNGGASATACGLLGRVVGTSVGPIRESLGNAHATVLAYVNERIPS